MYAIKYFKRKIYLFVCMLLATMILCMPSTPVYGTETKTVRVGYLLQNGFQEGNEDEYKSGYAYDYLQEIRNYTGWNYEYVYGTWDEILSMLEKGEVDVVSHVIRTEGREQKYLFSVEPQGSESHYLYVRADNNEFDTGDYTKLEGKVVGSWAGDYRTDIFKNWCEEQGIDCEIRTYSDIAQMHADLELGAIDVINESRMLTTSYPGERKSILRFEDRAVYFAVNKNRPDLLEEINEAQAKILEIDEFYGENLQSGYLQNTVTQRIGLTEREVELLDEHGIFTVGYCENRRPLSFTDESTGELSGLVRDYLDIMESTYSDVEFRTVAYPNEVTMTEALMNGEVDIATPSAYSATTAEKYNFVISDTIYQATMVAVYRGYEGTDVKDIFDKIVIADNSVTETDFVSRNYPNAKIVHASSVDEAIQMVQNGAASCYIMRSSYWSWYVESNFNLRGLYTVNIKKPANVIAAMRQEDAAYMAILNKGISLMDETQRVQSIVRYSDLADEVTISDILKRNPLMAIVAGIVIVLLLALFIVINRLVTESKYIEQLKIAKDEAEEARRQAETANLAKSNFMTSMSHDIRTPMNAVIGMTALATKHKNDPDYVENCLKKVTMASNHLLTLINDVLDINKIESGNLSMNPIVFSLADSIMNLANINRPLINEKEQKFEIHIHNVEHEYVFADRLRINQVFINLLSNAIKYTPVGGKISVDIKTENVPGAADKMRLIYIVEDDGVGMSEEFQEKMYEIFAMEEKQTRDTIGSGVGLAICKRLVDLMEGTIECESKLNHGTKFTVKLDIPIADKVVNHYMLPPIKTLLVDDDEIFLATASETLKDMGVSPDCVSSGEEAVRVVKEKHAQNNDYPVIIIDWKMSGMDGTETTRQIRKILGEEVSIIVISAYDLSDIQEDIIVAGANGFISKPFFRSSVYENLSEVLGITSRDEYAEDDKISIEGLRVLIAEDNEFNWEIAHEILSLHGVKATRAENGQKCLDILNDAQAGTYDMVLMDIQMPVMNGYEATKVIRAHEREDIKNIPIIAMTADAFSEDVARCMDIGMNAHVAKPLNLEQFVQVIGEIYDRTRIFTGDDAGA